VVQEEAYGDGGLGAGQGCSQAVVETVAEGEVSGAPAP
jgi:hypothetical protein